MHLPQHLSSSRAEQAGTVTHLSRGNRNGPCVTSSPPRDSHSQPDSPHCLPAAQSTAPAASVFHNKEEAVMERGLK